MNKQQKRQRLSVVVRVIVFVLAQVIIPIVLLLITNPPNCHGIYHNCAIAAPQEISGTGGGGSGH